MAQEQQHPTDAEPLRSREYWARVWVRAKENLRGKLRERIASAVITGVAAIIAAWLTHGAFELGIRAAGLGVVALLWWAYYVVPSLWRAPAEIERDQRLAASRACAERIAQVERDSAVRLKESQAFAFQLGLTNQELADQNEAMAARLRGLEPIEARARRLRAHSVTYNGMTRTAADFLVDLRRAHNFHFSDVEAYAALQRILNRPERDSQMDAILAGMLAQLLHESCISRGFPIQGRNYTMENDGRAVASWLHEHPL